MSVQSQTTNVIYQGDNITKVFNYPFRILNGSDLSVYLQDTVTGIIIYLTYNVDYSVTNVNNVNGGQVNTIGTPTATQIIFIGRLYQPYTQPMTFNNNQQFSLPALEQDLDSFALADQQLDLKNTLLTNTVESLVTDVNVIESEIININNEISQIEDEIAKFESLPLGTFFQYGIGSVYRTYLGKVREIVSITDFGAIGDGITDCTDAFQNAINSGAGKIYLPAGNYLCGTIQITSNTMICGDGFKTVLLQNSAKTTQSSTGIIFADSGSATNNINNIIIKDIMLQGNVVLQAFNEFRHLVSLNGVSNVYIDNVIFSGFQGDGLYLGSGITANQERHNKNVRVTSCLFDGINNDNRNGISIIDCDDIVISNNKFINCTRSNMPGAIDFEPDNNTYHIIKNCKVIHNDFYNIGGNIGAVSFALTNANFTTQPQNITVSHNSFEQVASPVTMLYSNSNYTNDLNFDFSFNQGYVTRAFTFIGTIYGLNISNNSFLCSQTGLLGFNVTDVMKRVNLSLNNFRSSSPTDAIVNLRSVQGCVVNNNKFSNFVIAISVGFPGTMSSDIIISNNIFSEPLTINNCINYVSGTADLTTCIISKNRNMQFHNFPAFITDNCGTVFNSDTALSFNSSTLPDTFPVGISTAIINGDSGVPDTCGGTQGTLITTHNIAQGGYQKFISQVFYPANNSLATGIYFYRKRQSIVNQWEVFTQVGQNKRTSIPTAGTYQSGDIVWNQNVGSGLPIGWICTGSGSPGTWTSIGTAA